MLYGQPYPHNNRSVNKHLCYNVYTLYENTDNERIQEIINGQSRMSTTKITSK